MRDLEHRTLRTLPLLVVGACLLWPSPASAGECGDPCTVTATVPDIHLVDTSSSTNSDDWEIRTEDGLLRVGRLAGNQQLFTLEIDAPTNTLHVGSLGLGHVGINTTVPAEELQINGTLPTIRLDNTQAGAGRANLMMFFNAFVLGGNTSQNIVAVDTRAPVDSFRIVESGRIGIGTGSPSAMLHVDGDARVDGNVVLGSSRTLKTAFDAVEPAGVLAKLTDLPIASWRYKTEDESTRHIGPFAEDFERLFGLGDGATISLIDAQGVALAAIQGLQERVAAKDSELELRLAEKEAELARLRREKDAQIAELTARLAALEDRLDAE